LILLLGIHRSDSDFITKEDDADKEFLKLSSCVWSC